MGRLKQTVANLMNEKQLCIYRYIYLDFSMTKNEGILFHY